MTRSTFPWIHPALAACLWAVAFGLLSLSWAAGGGLDGFFVARLERR